MIDLDTAYLAGFIDGEGSIQVSRGVWQRWRSGYTLHLGVKQVDPEPLRMLAERYGGRVIQVPAKPGHLQHYRWGIVARQAARALRDLLPYMRVKRGQAELALLFMSLPRMRGGRSPSEWDYAERDSFVESLREAKRLEFA